MSSKAYKSAETVLDSSSDEDDDIRNQTLIQQSRSPSQRSTSVISSLAASSSASESPQSSTPSDSPSSSSYRYNPPNGFILSSSKEKSILPTPREGDELFLLRLPKDVDLNALQFNFGKRKVRIGDEEWKLLDEESGDVKIIQPTENSELFQFARQRFTMGWTVVRDVKMPTAGKGVATEETPAVKEKKRKRDEEGSQQEEKRKKDKHSKQEDGEKSKKKEKHRDKDADTQKKDKHKSDKEKKKREKHKHRHS